MKKIILANETAQAILTKIEAFKTDKNKVRVEVGLKNLGDGIACKAVIVNGGMMADIGFKSAGVPKDYTEGAEPYFTIVVSAASFTSYLKAFLAFNANIELDYDEKSTVSMKVGSLAKVSIETVAEMDAMLVSEHKTAFAMVKVETDKLLNAMKIGGYLATNAVDERGITDRVVLKFDDNQVTAYSTDGSVMSKAWCEAALKFNEANRCVAYLKEKLQRVTESGKAAFMEQLKEAGTSAEKTIELAKAEGYRGGALSIALPVASLNVMKSVFSGAEALNIMISANQMVVNSGNVLATFSLAGKASEVFTKTVDPWANTEWTSRVVVDKEALVNALSIIRLGVSGTGNKKNLYPFHSGSKSNKLVLTDSKKNLVSVAPVAFDGELSSINVHLDVEKVLTIIGKLSNGNLVISYYVAPNGKSNYPVCISNGDLEGKGTASYTYVLPVNVRENPQTEETTEEKVEAKAENATAPAEEPKPVTPPVSQDDAVSEGEDVPELDDAGIDEMLTA